MSSDKNPKVLSNNIDFFRANLKTLLSIRPNTSFIFKEQGKNVHYSPVNYNFKNINEFIDLQQTIRTINSSILFNCFGLFEACFEWKLLNEINFKGLSGIQEKIILSRIDNIIKISSFEGYLNEYKFLNNKDFIKNLTPFENKMLMLIKGFYVVRHMLIHGSAIRKVKIPAKGSGWWLRLDEEDNQYQRFLDILKENIDLQISNINLNLDILLLNNQVLDLLIRATTTITNKLIVGYRFKFFDDDV